MQVDYLLLPLMPSPFGILSGELICLSLTIRWQEWRKFLIYPCKTCGNVIIFRRATRTRHVWPFRSMSTCSSVEKRIDSTRFGTNHSRGKSNFRADRHTFSWKPFKSKTFTQIQTTILFVRTQTDVWMFQFSNQLQHFCRILFLWNIKLEFNLCVAFALNK